MQCNCPIEQHGHLMTTKALLLESPLTLLPIPRLAPLSLVAPTPRGSCKGVGGRRRPRRCPKRILTCKAERCYLLQQCLQPISAHHVASCHPCSALVMSKLGLQLGQGATNSHRSEVKQCLKYWSYDEIFVTTITYIWQERLAGTPVNYYYYYHIHIYIHIYIHTYIYICIHIAACTISCKAPACSSLPAGCDEPPKPPC